MGKVLSPVEKYLAPGISGVLNDNGDAEVYDEFQKCKLDPNNTDDLITIYERQVKNWFLNVAKEFKSQNDILDSCFVKLMIAISYIEGNQSYREGRSSDRQSKAFFCRGLKRIVEQSGEYTISEAECEVLYGEIRCGLFHTGMTKDSIIISSEFEQPIQIITHNGIDEIGINHQLLLDLVIQDFDNYINLLRNSNEVEAREKFSRMFNILINQDKIRLSAQRL